MLPRAFNLFSFYCGWFACVAAAAGGAPWLGPMTAAGLLAVHLLWGTRKAGREIVLLALVGAIGCAVETIQVALGLYAFRQGDPAPWPCPPWMVALWMLFASTLNSSLAWLARRRGLAALMGAFFGPVSYVAGARLGAIELAPDMRYSAAGIGAVWAVVMPTLLIVRDKVCGREA